MQFESPGRRAGSLGSAVSRSIPSSGGATSATRRPGRSSATCSRTSDFHRLEIEVYGFNERRYAHAEAGRLGPRGREEQGVLAPRRLGRRRTAWGLCGRVPRRRSRGLGKCPRAAVVSAASRPPRPAPPRPARRLQRRQLAVEQRRRHVVAFPRARVARGSSSRRPSRKTKPNRAPAPASSSRWRRRSAEQATTAPPSPPTPASAARGREATARGPLGQRDPGGHLPAALPRSGTCPRRGTAASVAATARRRSSCRHGNAHEDHEHAQRV
jgi:hypothetical protein